MKGRFFAIDFDGTIAEEGYFPSVGRLIPDANRVIKRIRDNGGKVAIWTCRTGDQAELVKAWLKVHNIDYDKFNEPFDEMTVQFGNESRKVFCDYYIEDRNIDTVMNGGIDWIKIEKFIFGNSEVEVPLIKKLVKCGVCNDTGIINIATEGVIMARCINCMD